MPANTPPKRFDIYAVVYALPAAILYDFFVVLSLGLFLLGIATIVLLPVYLLWLIVNFCIIAGYTVWFFLKWRSLVKQDGFSLQLLFGAVLVWLVWLLGAILSVFLPFLTLTLLFSTWLTNHYLGIGKLVDWTINIATIGSGYLAKAGAKAAAGKAIQLAAARKAAQEAGEKVAAKAGARVAARVGGAEAKGGVAVAGRGAVPLEEIEAREASGVAKAGEERLPWEEKSPFEKMQEYFEEPPDFEKNQEDDSDNLSVARNKNKTVDEENLEVARRKNRSIDIDAQNLSVARNKNKTVDEENLEVARRKLGRISSSQNTDGEGDEEEGPVVLEDDENKVDLSRS